MGKSWLPLKDEPLLTFCSAFVARITPAPQAYGLTQTHAETLDTLVKNYADVLALNADPAARTPTTAAAKQMAKVALSAGMRIVYKQLTAANLPNAQRAALGLPVVGEGHMRIAAAAEANPNLATPGQAASAMKIAA
jgi:hypothetical protein